MAPLLRAPTPALPPGVRLLRGALAGQRRETLLEEVIRVLEQAPLFTPRMPGSGRPFSVRMSNAGSLGWVSDKEGGYRYQPHHPETGRPWPPMPKTLIALWQELAAFPALPEAALINHYAPRSRMGLHVDNDEAEPRAPILSISLGCDATFRLGGLKRSDPTMSFRLQDGDVLILEGPGRFLHHGIDRIHPGTGSLPREIGEGRLNITLRRVRAA